jgi:hypothetical protein
MVPSQPETEFDPDLARLNAAWTMLPAPIRTATLGEYLLSKAQTITRMRTRTQKAGFPEIGKPA